MARIIKGVGGLYQVDLDGEIYSCKARGLFRKHNLAPLAGDICDINIVDKKEKTGTIIRIHERTSLLTRPRAANVSRAILVFALAEPPFNPDLLDRLIISIERRGVPVVICFNKSDMAETGQNDIEIIKQIYNAAGYKVLFVSARTGAGLDSFRALIDGEVSILAGPSGAGKSSIVNALSPEAQMVTGQLSKKISRGRHTTRHTELIKCGDGYILDSPGFSSVYLEGLDKGELKAYFHEFEPFAQNCRFGNCAHIEEQCCKVTEAVKEGKINAERYQRYVNYYRELT